MSISSAPDDQPKVSESPLAFATANKLVNRLCAVVFLEWLGAGALLPLLPIYLRDRGASTTLVGATMASFFLAGLLCQFPAGKLSDKFGRKPVLVGGLLAYALASLAYLLPMSTYSFLVLRFIQGGAAGSVEVASLALLSSAIPIARRGSASSKIYSAQFSGIAIGPLLGTIAGIAHMGLLFIITAVLCGVAAIPVLTSSTIDAHDARDQPTGKLEKIKATPALVGAILAAVALGTVFGAYESCWSLLLHSRGATIVEIGLSWTFFSVPYVVFVRAGGWAADKYDRRYLALGGLTFAMVFCALWPYINSLYFLVAGGFIEAIGSSMALPSIQGLLTQQRKTEELGRVQGLYSTGQTAAIAISASFAGALFGINRAFPFVITAAIGSVLLLFVALKWRSVIGKASDLPGQAAAVD